MNQEEVTFLHANVPDDGNSYWFPMRVSYGRSLAVAECLRARGVQHFMPSQETIVARKAEGQDNAVIKEVPIISNLIFIYGTRTEIRELKSESAPLSYLRFMAYGSREDGVRNPTAAESLIMRRIIVVPKHEMDQFIKVVEIGKEHITLIPYEEMFRHYGKRVRFVDGPFKGMEATVRRIGKQNKNKKIHFEIDGLIVAEADYIPRRMYELIE